LPIIFSAFACFENEVAKNALRKIALKNVMKKVVKKQFPSAMNT
jgi:hypothetical protein